MQVENGSWRRRWSRGRCERWAGLNCAAGGSEQEDTEQNKFANGFQNSQGNALPWIKIGWIYIIIIHHRKEEKLEFDIGRCRQYCLLD